MTIRFENIRSYRGSQNTGFEELVCQIARRQVPDDADQYVRIEGAGGDGGVEAYWTKTGGGKVGYQAKYFLASKSVDWAQIDKSVETAIDVHPDLSVYVLAIPCDLTGKTGDKGRGKSGWEHWETHKKKWEGWASARSMNIKFECWSASEILDRLTTPSMEGVVCFWFDTVRFTDAWLSERFEEAIANLDERYHPEDHVVVGLSRVFEGLTRSAIFSRNIRTSLGSVKSPKELQRDHPSDLVPISENVWSELIHAHSALSQIIDGLDLPHWQKNDVTRWRVLTLSYRDQLAALMNVVREVDLSGIPDQERRAANNQIRHYQTTISEVYSTVDHFVRVLDDIDVQADQYRVALVYGEPGSGKSHLVADAMLRHLSSGGVGILLLGQQFSNADPLATISTCLGIVGQPDALLQALDVAAEARRGRCLIAVDALNEAPDLKVWNTHLAGFVTRVSRFRNLSLVLTCRPEYRDYLVPSTVREKMVEAECYGFVTHDLSPVSSSILR